jgi:hypothetical protein
VIRHEGPHDRGGLASAREEQPVGEHGREVAHEQGRRAADAIGLGRQRQLARTPGEVGRRRRDPSTMGGGIHQVVVHERHRVEQLDGGGRPHDGLLIDDGAVRRHGCPVAPDAEGRSQPLAPGRHEPADLEHEQRRMLVDAGEVVGAAGEIVGEDAVDRPTHDADDVAAGRRGRGHVRSISQPGTPTRHYHGSRPARRPRGRPDPTRTR